MLRSPIGGQADRLVRQGVTCLVARIGGLAATMKMHRFQMKMRLAEHGPKGVNHTPPKVSPPSKRCFIMFISHVSPH